MANLVVILGAGASADFGVPTLNSVFEDNEARRYVLSNRPLLGMLETLFWHPRGHTLVTANQSINIEQMLTILRDLENEAAVNLPLTKADLVRFRRDLYVLIQRAVFEGKSSGSAHLNPIINIAQKNFDQITWASFNWDCIFEASFWYSQGINPYLPINPRDWYQGWQKNQFLKLHGSINWWLQANEIWYYRFSGGGELAKKWADYAASATPDSPVILEPSFYKYQDTAYLILQGQWADFLQSLLKADYVIVIGYSLPEGDSMARSKILTGFQANPNSRWLLIDPSEGICHHYARLLGTVRLKVRELRLRDFNGRIMENLREDFPSLALS